MLADGLEAAPTLAARNETYGEINPVWRHAHQAVYKMAYIWDYGIDEPLLGPEERVAYLEEIDEENTYGLVDLVSSSCLDLAQHIDSSLTFVDAEHRPQAGARAISMMRELADIPLGDRREQESLVPGLAVFGPSGIETWTA